MALSAIHADVIKVPVALDDRSYEILIGDGLIDRAGAEISKVVPGARAAIVTDENVAALHLPRLVDSLAASGIQAISIVVPAGEKSKSYSEFARVCDAVIAAKLERRDMVIGFGGGVVGDLSGFVAASVRRGMRFVQIPTSLLAQVDSSVGGKTGINSPLGKNLVGAFWQPQLVLADTGLLTTLSPREFRAGYAEVVKYGLIDLPEFFHWLEKNRDAVFADGAARAQAIATSCRAKAAVVARDEQETGDRALLNLGHTFGHAIEAAAGYDGEVVVHGEAVAIGMVMAHRFSVMLGLASETDAQRVEAHLRAAGLPLRIADLGGHNLPGGQALSAMGSDTMLGFMAQDKKVVRGALTFVLTHGIGKSFVAKDVPQDKVRDFLAQTLNAAT
jgi:3-dehydroquinate synthase